MNSLTLPSMNLKAIENTQLFNNLRNKLREDTWFKPMLDYAEQSTMVDRIYLVTGASAIMLLLLLVEYGTALVTGCIGFLYPGYKTLILLQNTHDVEAGRRWLIYWFLYSALNFVEIFLFFLDWIPIYWFFKCFFLLWCFAPVQINGADIVYAYLIQPFFQRNQEAIDNAISHVVMTALSIRTETDQLVEPVVVTNGAGDKSD